ncbi:MAG: benzoyl-CoA-dihydrodiol lyase [Myxococcales bacterium]|nr:benzoyl-CoA-dihydrodiol lyase [Myxococcales bacterium]USN50004.1 MAG: benzoyl-CoA-dihydrodiol lyase [Myxococcales bacterium]
MSAKQSFEPTHFSFSTSPHNYQHLKLKIDNDEATIFFSINAEKSLRGDTPLKLNSYDLSVDIELHDAINRLRFEHPNVQVVTITSVHPQIFCAGANIYMLKKSSHAFKVNFCKYTNETRLYIEEASKYSNKKFICALNGTAAGGGYELALACDRIILIDDKNANVSLPEVPLLGVLPGTGGLTRLVDKRAVRRDIADVFCTLAEGFKGQKAKDLGLVDESYAKSKWDEALVLEKEKYKKAAENLKGIDWPSIEPRVENEGFSYENVEVSLKANRIAHITIKAPTKAEPDNSSSMLEAGSELWILKTFRELDDAILRLRFFYKDYGLWHISTKGDQDLILQAERPLYDGLKPDAHWFLRELLLHTGRVLKRMDTSSRSIMCTVDESSAFAGVLAELLFVADRSYALDTPDSSPIILSPINKGLLLGWNDLSRLETRFYGHKAELEAAYQQCCGKKLSVNDAHKLGLLTFVLDDIDFPDELRLALEERASLSPDALSTMEANLRAVGPETMATKIFGRLSSFQNWVFIRENATGARGALTSYGEATRAQFDWERV